MKKERHLDKVGYLSSKVHDTETSQFIKQKKFLLINKIEVYSSDEGIYGFFPFYNIQNYDEEIISKSFYKEFKENYLEKLKAHELSKGIKLNVETVNFYKGEVISSMVMHYEEDSKKITAIKFRTQKQTYVFGRKPDLNKKEVSDIRKKDSFLPGFKTSFVLDNNICYFSYISPYFEHDENFHKYYQSKQPSKLGMWLDRQTKWFLGLSIALYKLFIILFVVLFPMGFYYFKTQTWTGGEVTVPEYNHKFSNDVKIFTDPEYGFTHIKADSSHDAYFSLGFMHAKERLWQMDMMRRLGRGKLSEVFGKKTLYIDRIIRNFGLNYYSEKFANDARKLSKHLDYYTAYISGINYFANYFILPVEYHVTRVPWQDWTLADTIAVQNFMSLTLTHDWNMEVWYRVMEDNLGKDFADLIISFRDVGYPYANETIVSDFELKTLKMHKVQNQIDEEERIKKDKEQQEASIKRRRLEEEQRAIKQAEEDRKIREEEDRLRRQEEERIRKQQEEVERLKKIEAERIRKEQEEVERLRLLESKEKQKLAEEQVERAKRVEEENRRKAEETQRLKEQQEKAAQEEKDRFRIAEEQANLKKAEEEIRNLLLEENRKIADMEIAKRAEEEKVKKQQEAAKANQQQKQGTTKPNQQQKQGANTNQHKQANKQQARKPDATIEVPKVSEEEESVIKTTLQNDGASNSWAISGEHTESGFPVLSNDPHLTNGMPSLFYLQKIYLPNDILVGGSIPGLPIVVTGANSHLSWGFTTDNTDAADICEEKIEDDYYIYDNQRVRLDKTQEIILIKGEEAEHMEIKWTRNGPVINDKVSLPKEFLVFNFEYKTETHLSIRLSLYNYDFTGSDFYFALNSGKSSKDFLSEMDKHTGPNLNLLWASRDGEIGWAPIGKFPVKNYKNRFCRGYSSEDSIQKYITRTDLPLLINPDKGFIVTANNKMASFNYTYEIIGFHNHVRAYRIRQMIEERIIKSKKFSIDDNIAMMDDVKDSLAESMLSNVLKIVEKNSKGKQVMYLEELKKWDFTMHKYSNLATIYSVLELNLGKNLLTQKVTDIKARGIISMLHYWNFLSGLIEKIANGERVDLKQCSYLTGNMNCEKYVVHIFYNLDNYLTEYKDFTGRVKTWGELKFQYYPHNPFELIPVINRIFSRKQYTGGNRNTVKVARGPFNNAKGEFASTHSARLKFISDMADPTNPYTIIDGGNSGNVFSKFYDNLMQKCENTTLIQFKDHDFSSGLDLNTITLRNRNKK